MQQKIKKIIKEKLNEIDQIANEKFIDSRTFNVFKAKLNEIINENYEVNMLEVKDYIDIEIEKLLRSYNYYNFHGLVHYTKFNSKAEKGLHKLLGWGSEEEK